MKLQQAYDNEHLSEVDLVTREHLLSGSFDASGLALKETTRYFFTALNKRDFVFKSCPYQLLRKLY